MAKDKTVVISDLHIDTWKNHQIHGRPKIDYFIEFVREVVEPEAANLVVNGDILDAPPLGEDDILPMYEEVMKLLVELTATTNVYYFIGNHDIGLWGLYVRDYQLQPEWKKLNVIYPGEPRLLVEPFNGQGKVFLYFEHGHFYDPFLGLYVAKVARQTYPPILRLRLFLYRLLGLKNRSDELQRRRRVTVGQLTRDVFRAAQRRDSRGTKIAPNGLAEDKRTWWKSLKDWVAGRPAEMYKEAHWREAAGKVFERLRSDYPDAEVKAVVFGHTHVPDCAEISHDGRRALYLNSGDWSGPTPSMGDYTDNSSFIVFDADGNVIDKDGEVLREANLRAVRDYIGERFAAQNRAPMPAEAPPI